MAKSEAVAVVEYDRTQILTYKKCLARVMLDQGKTWAEVGVVTGLSTYAIGRVSRDEYDFPPGMLKALRSRRGQTWEAISSIAQEAIMEKLLDPDEIAKINPLQLATVAGIAEDKAKQLELGDDDPADETLGELSYSEIGTYIEDLRSAMVKQYDDEHGSTEVEATAVTPPPRVSSEAGVFPEQAEQPDQEDE